MRRRYELPPESFDELLAWLNPDRGVAAELYLDLRHSLVKIFAWNRCSDPDGMADETLDRVARQAGRLKETYEGNPNLFFYGVANNLIREYQKKIKTHVPIEDVDLPDESGPEDGVELSLAREDCLQRCLKKLNAEKGEQVLAYYSKEKHAKIDHRAEMARKLGISVENLRVRMCRLRVALEDCIEKCMDQFGGEK
jgi:DNA-directed RNA polymerase specialized sigma24 family protein